ncbi:MAG: hypothetical protein AB7F25_12490 [Deferribacterales bacterium]
MTKLIPNSFILPLSYLLTFALGYYLLAPVYALAGNTPEDRIANIIFGLIMGFLIMLPVKFAVKAAFSLYSRLSRP